MIRPAVQKKPNGAKIAPWWCVMSVTSLAIFGKSAGVNPPVGTALAVGKV
jgi:hypothetical protein